MSAPQKPRGDVHLQAGKAEEHTKQRHRHRRSPCGNPPSTPNNLSSGFDHAEGGRGNNRHRLWGRWTEVATDTSGFSSRVKFYRLHVEYSANTTNAGSVSPGTEDGDWFVAHRDTIPAKLDADANSMVRFVLKGIHTNLTYRWFVLADDVDGCLSARAWITPGNPGVDEPPAPSNVKAFEGATDRIVVRFTEPPDPDPARDDTHPDVVDHGAEISLLPTFDTIYDRDRHFRGNRTSFRPDKADLGKVFYARAWSNDEDGRHSAKIPAWNPDLHGGQGNSDPFATPDGVGIARGQREKVIWFIQTPVDGKTYATPWTADRDYDVRKAKVTVSLHDPATHPADGAPSGGPLKVQLVRITADQSTRDNMMPSDDRLRVEAGQHKDAQFVEDFLVTEVLDQEQVVPKVITANGATDVVVTLIVDPKG